MALMVSVPDDICERLIRRYEAVYGRKEDIRKIIREVLSRWADGGFIETEKVIEQIRKDIVDIKNMLISSTTKKTQINVKEVEENKEEQQRDNMKRAILYAKAIMKNNERVYGETFITKKQLEKVAKKFNVSALDLATELGIYEKEPGKFYEIEV